MDVYALKVTLLETAPPVWRHVLVQKDITLDRLHKILQVVMGWTGSHLHQFRVSSTSKSRLGPIISNESRLTLGEVLSARGMKLLYEYDFGDGWQHELKLEEILTGDEDFLPLCAQGARRCPPEDCGGPHGFAELLEAIKDEDHPEHDSCLDWLGGDFDPGSFNVKEINYKLATQKSLRPRRASK